MYKRQIYGECEVSKNVLEADTDTPIRSFRAGHLAYPKYLIDVLDDLGYEYNSSYSASDVLTNFPYLNKKGRSFSGDRSKVYELPVTISDVFHDDPISSSNYLEKADTWLDVTLKNRANGAPTVLLIHPNRNFKLAGMAYYLDHLPNDIKIMEMSLFGDFWKARNDLHFDTYLEDEMLTLTIPSYVDLNNNISFIVNKGQLLTSIMVKDDNNQTLDFIQQNWEDNDVILYYKNAISTTAHVLEKASISLKIYPNPSLGKLNFEFEAIDSRTVQIDLFDLYGKKIYHFFSTKTNGEKQNLVANISEEKFSPGVYFVVLQSDEGEMIRKKIVLM